MHEEPCKPQLIIRYDFPQLFIAQYCRTRHYHIFYDRACTGSELYIKWGSRNCLNGEINLFVGHIVTSNNLKDVDGDYICLPNEHNAYSTRIQNAKLRLEDVNDANGKNIPCAACVVRDRSIIFTFTNTTTCHQKWSVEYVGFLASNPENLGENICVDTATSNGLLNNPSKDLAVIATGSYNAYDARVQAAGCCVLALCALFERNCINLRILLQRSNCCSVYELNANNY